MLTFLIIIIYICFCDSLINILSIMNYFISYQSNIVSLYRNVNAVLLILVVGLKFLFDVILEWDIVLLNIVLYCLFLLMVNYRKITWDFFYIPIYLFISILNPSAFACLYVFMIVYLLKNCSLKLISYANIMVALIVVFTVYLFIDSGDINVREDVYVQLDNIRVRKDYGFGNPNQFAAFCFTLITSLFIALWEKYKKIFVAIFVSIGVAVSNYTDSRSFQLSCLILTITCVFQILRFDKNKVYKLFVLLLPFILFIYSFMFPYYDINDDFNAISSGRMILYKSLLDSVTLKDYIIGTNLVNEITIDSTYLHLIFRGGVIYLITFYALYIYAFKNKYQYIYPYLPILVSILVYGAFETLFVNCTMVSYIMIWIILSHDYSCLRSNNMILK